MSNLEDEAGKYRKSLDGMKAKAAKLGTRMQDQPGYSFTNKKWTDVNAVARQRRTNLERQYVATLVSEVADETRGMLEGKASMKGIPARISSLKGDVRDRLDDVKSHLNH